MGAQWNTEDQNTNSWLMTWWPQTWWCFFGCVANKNSLSQIWTYPIIYKQKRSKKTKRKESRSKNSTAWFVTCTVCCLKYVVWCMYTVSWFSTMGFMFFIRSKIEMRETFTFYIPKISSFMVQTVQTMEIPQIQRGQPRSFVEFFNVRHWFKIQRHPPFPKVPAKCFFLNGCQIQFVISSTYHVLHFLHHLHHLNNYINFIRISPIIYIINTTPFT